MKHIFELRMKDQIEERSDELTIWPAPSWLDSSVGRVLHRHRRGHGFESRSSLNFFQAFFSQLLKLRSNWEDLSSIWSFIRSSNICFIYLHSFIHPSRVYYELTIWPAPSWLDSSVGRALHRHRRGHGFESRSSPNFFQAFFSQLLKLRSNWEDLSSIWSFIRSSNICFIYLHSLLSVLTLNNKRFKMLLTEIINFGFP